MRCHVVIVRSGPSREAMSTFGCVFDDREFILQIFAAAIGDYYGLRLIARAGGGSFVAFRRSFRRDHRPSLPPISDQFDSCIQKVCNEFAAI